MLQVNVTFVHLFNNVIPHTVSNKNARKVNIFLVHFLGRRDSQTRTVCVMYMFV